MMLKSSVNSPYTTLPERAFWRPAVADRNAFALTDLYRKKFSIASTDRIATAGSCFAQHVGKAMQRSGFSYLDTEPAPTMLPPELRRRLGYEIYSARYGNIYTTRQLVQLFDRAFGIFEPTDQDWLSDTGNYFDGFRPALEPVGFGSIEEIRVMRQAHLNAVRTMFETLDVFVFTLGLTEAWQSKTDGAVYPICPGTIAGTFSPDRYSFVNFDCAAVITDLRFFISKLRSVRSSARMILTVSPVPLTATASGNHVLVATTYSKSVLRAAAGSIAAEYDFVDYVPSFEMIATHPMRGIFYEPNMRDISPRGVDFVMGHFFAEHKISTPTMSTTKPVLHQDDLACEEVLLQAQAPR